MNINTANQQMMRRLNNQIVINILKKQGPLSRANISAISGLNRSTISAIINDLIDEGWVRETIFQADKIGRPGMLLEINPAGGFAVGMDLGVDFILSVVMDLSANVIWRKRIETDPAEGQTLIQEKAFDLTAEAIRIGKQHCFRALGIGISVPGLVDVHQGVLKFAPNLKWKDIPLRLLWTQQFHLPAIIENEANAAALGEFYYGAAKGIENFIYIAAGYGLGSGIIIDGELLRGNKGYASEVGHMTTDPNGDLCSCGKRGCYEIQIGPRAVINRADKLITEEGIGSTFLQINHRNANGFSYDAIVDAARKKDKVAVKALEEVGCKLGVLVSNLVNIFDPKMVILGGALNYAKDFILPFVRKVVKENALQLCQEDLIIANSLLDQDSSVMGAASLVLENYWKESGLPR